VKVLHLVRRAEDPLAWEAIAAQHGVDDVRVVLLGAAVGTTPPGGIAASALPYDQLVSLIEWSDRVVTW
jgi:hypothetical protein